MVYILKVEIIVFKILFKKSMMKEIDVKLFSSKVKMKMKLVSSKVYKLCIN